MNRHARSIAPGAGRDGDESPAALRFCPVSHGPWPTLLVYPGGRRLVCLQPGCPLYRRLGQMPFTLQRALRRVDRYMQRRDRRRRRQPRDQGR